MPYAEFNSSQYSGMGGIFQYAKAVVPFYDSMLFGFILIVLTFSIYFIQESKKGRGDFPVALAVGCTATTVLAIILGMLSGFVATITLSTLIVLTILSYIWLFYTD